jgi:AcrR family transcriptional regulator
LAASAEVRGGESTGRRRASGTMTVTKPRLGRPAGANGKQTRARILSAAMRCVAEVGYSQATIREIARTAEMTSGSLYHYFPNKSELLEATVREIEEIAFPRLRAAAAQTDDVVERLWAVLDESDRLTREYPHLAAFERAMRTESTLHPAGRPTYAGLKALRDIIEEIIEDARAQGSLPAETKPSAAVDAIYALTRGLTEQAANLTPGAYAATLASARQLIRGTLFTRTSGAPV